MSNLLPKGKPNRPVHCSSCGHEFPQDPPFNVSCPTCLAGAGTYCKRPSGHSGPFVPFHVERDLLALQNGYYDHRGEKGCGPNSDSDKAKSILSHLKI